MSISIPYLFNSSSVIGGSVVFPLLSILLGDVTDPLHDKKS
ncbi:hypothetical protein R4K89_03105 [Brachyspira intermedia]